MKASIRAAYRDILAVDNETPRVLDFVRRASVEISRPVVIDVGCGYGRTLRSLNAAGIDAVGIDVNAEIVARNRNAGLVCYLPDEFRSLNLRADVLVMSHVVEHFTPRELLDFMNEYLDCLRPDGFLVIATPLMGNRFFDDFDHVRPYQPQGFGMVFGSGGAQVQYQGRHRLELVDLWFRRSPFTSIFARGLYVRSWSSPWVQFQNLMGALLFRLSCGLLGRLTGWVGLFRKAG